MRAITSSRALLLALIASTTAACATTDDGGGEWEGTPAPDQSGPGGGKEDAPGPGPEVAPELRSPDIGQFFMIDHYGVVASGYNNVKSMIRNKNLGAIILWNPQQANGEVLRSMLRAYSDTAATAGKDEVFYSTDHEESRTQRFSTRHGFTGLAAATVLGDSEDVSRACELQARITSRELASVGLNMSLGTVSDIYYSNSGTRGMFASRAIDSDPALVSECITAMTRAFAEEGNVTFITKHFPGLGNATGNTDVSANVRTRNTTASAMERELRPYREASADVNERDEWPTFGAMISHASYAIIDGAGVPGTYSKKILTDLLRSPATQSLALGGTEGGAATRFNGMGFRGVTVSDAFWTWAAVAELPAIERQRGMARSFLAGMDIVMIKMTDFNGAFTYFQMIWADLLPAAEKTALVAASGYPSWEALRTAFRARVTESAARIRTAKSRIGRATENMGTGPATNASTELVSEYRRLTQ